MQKRSFLFKSLSVAVAVVICMALVFSGCAAEETEFNMDSAQKEALDDAGLSVENVDELSVAAAEINGVKAFEVSFVKDGTLYTYTVTATDGIIEKKLSGEEMSPAEAKATADKAKDENDVIAEEKAIEICLEDAELDESDVTIQKCQLGYDDGLAVYEVEFIYEDSEYDYEINAETGEIVDWSVEQYKEESVKTSSDKNSTKSSAAIDEAAAKKLALKHAGLKESDVRFTKSKLDSEDGVKVYEIEFITDDGIEYEYEIKVSDGSILDWDKDFDID